MRTEIDLYPIFILSLNLCKQTGWHQGIFAEFYGGQEIIDTLVKIQGIVVEPKINHAKEPIPKSPQPN